MAMNDVTADVKQLKPEIAMHFFVLKIKVKIIFYPLIPCFSKGHYCLEGSQTSRLSPSGKSNT